MRVEVAVVFLRGIDFDLAGLLLSFLSTERLGDLGMSLIWLKRASRDLRSPLLLYSECLLELFPTLLMFCGTTAKADVCLRGSCDCTTISCLNSDLACAETSAVPCENLVGLPNSVFFASFAFNIIAVYYL